MSASHESGSFASRDASRAELRLRFGLPAAALLFVGWLALQQLRPWFELWPGVSVWYAPGALLAAGCILWGWRALLPIYAGSAVTVMILGHGSEPLWWFLLTSLALKLVYVAGAAALRRLRFDARFGAPRDVMLFATFAVLSATISALLNSADLVYAGVVPAGEWRNATVAFLVGDLVAVLALTPMLLVAVHRADAHPRGGTWRYRPWRAPAQALTVPLALWLAFGVAPHLGFLAYALCFLPLGWVALTQGVRGATIMTAALTIGAVAMLHNSGAHPRDNLEMQTFMASLAMAGLLLGSVTEVTTRGRALLAESEERYRALVELLPMPLAVHREGRVIYANPAMARAFGAPSTEALVGRSLVEMAEPTSQRLVQERADRIAAGEVLDTASHRFRRLDGGPSIDLEAVSRPIPYSGGTAALTVAHDVTARNRLEAELRHSQRMDAVGQLAGGVAHDFNNLLTVIISYGRMMAAETKPEEELHEYATEMLDAAGRAAALTRRLLAFSRKQVSQPREVAVNEVVAAAETMLRRLLGPTTELRVSLCGDAGAVLIDPVSLDQVILNLALNGRDAMPGGGTLTIATRLVEVPGEDARWGRLPGGRYAALVVRDEGTGIDPAIRERIFDPFFTTKEAGRGTGLGLATVYGIVGEAKGSIFVDTAPGAGSTFTVLLPSRGAVTAGPDAAGARGDAEPRSAAARRVLLVEDEEAVRAVTRKVLERAGYVVEEAPDGRRALAAVEAMSSLPDVVVSDLAMPELNGTALARTLRERWPGLPVILLSGFADAAREGEMAGTTLLAKPLDPQALVAAIEGAVRR